MKNMTGPGGPVRHSQMLMTCKSLIIKSGCFLPGSYIFIQMLQFDIKDCSLYGVEPAVTSHYIMIIFFTLAMVSDHFHPVGQRVVISKNRATVPKSAEVFGGIKGSGP